MLDIENLGNLFKVTELGSEFRATSHLSLSLTDGFPGTMDF